MRLGVWQLDRLDERRAFNDRVSTALAFEAVPLDGLLATGADPAYRRVSVTGSWDPIHEVILYGRALDGRPGNHVLTPFWLGDGRAVLVDRGWVPSEVATPPVEGEAAAATGEITVEGIVVPPVADGDGYDELPAQVRAIDLTALDEVIPATLVTAGYVQLQRQTPAQARPVPAPLPELTEGPHLSYAIQWFTFAAIAVIGYGLLVRRDRRRVTATQAASDDRRS